MKLKVLLALAGLLAPLSGALAQPSGSNYPPVTYLNAVGNFSSPGVTLQTLNGSGKAVPVSSSTPLPVSGTFSASLAGFTPNGNYTNLTSTGSASASTALPTGTSFKVTNNGTTGVSCTLAVGAATGVRNNLQINAGSSRGITVSSPAYDHLSCINQVTPDAASNVVVVEGGSGLAGDAGGGSSGGSSGGSVTQGTVPWVVSNAGTFAVQAAQSGTWTVQPGNTANTTAWLVTGTGGTFPASQLGTWNITNISGTVSLPTGAATSANQSTALTSLSSIATNTTGAATAAKQPSLGTAGTPSTNVLTMQGIASMTPILATATQSGTWTVQPGNTANTTAWLVTGTGGTFPATQSGTWTVQPGNTANTTPWLSSISQGGNTAVVKPASGAPSAADPALVVGISPNSWDVGSGTSGTKTQRVILDSTQVGALGTASPGTAATKSELVGGIYNSSPPTLTTGQQASLQFDINGNVKTLVSNANNNGAALASASSPTVQAVDQCPSKTSNIVANNTTAVVANSAATTLCAIQVFGIGTDPAWLKIYNATSATCGSGTPVKRILIPAAGTAANGAGAVIPFPGGSYLSTGFTYCVTKLLADSDTTAPAANTYVVNADWR